MRSKFIQEIRLLARLRHPNLILFMGYCTQPDLCIVSEFMARGSLYHILRQYHHEGQVMEPQLQRHIAASVARGMCYLHTRTPPIVHMVCFEGTPLCLLHDKLTHIRNTHCPSM